MMECTVRHTAVKFVGGRFGRAGPAGRRYLRRMSEPRITVILLAAGRSSRFGPADKLTADLRGLPVIRRAAEASLAVGSVDVCVVMGSEGVVEALRTLPVRFARADPLDDAMGSSIAAGVRASPGAAAWLVWPGDMPLIRPQTARQVVAAYHVAWPVVPISGSGRGHPVLFPARFRPQLEALREDRGARPILLAADRVVEVHVDDPGIHLDIDSPEDLRAAARLVR
jgi:molybdenum cofactor cytidylyltransferase